MTYSEFFDEYALNYRIKECKQLRVRNDALLNTKIIIYLLRREFRLTYREIAKLVLMSYQLTNIYYYDILRDERNRKEAQARFKEITGVRNVPQSQAS